MGRRKGAGLEEEDRKQRRRGEKVGGAAPCGNRAGGGCSWKVKEDCGHSRGQNEKSFFFFFGPSAEDDLSHLFRQLTQPI